MLRLGRSLIGVAVLCCAAGCEKKKTWSASQIDSSFLEISSDVFVTQGPVGMGRHQTQASYVLVDVKNRFTGDVEVTLEGTLLGHNGQKIGALRHQSLRIPSDGRRMFALIDSENTRREAVHANVVVRGATPLSYPPAFVIEAGTVRADGDRAVVRGTVKNTAKRDGSAIVIAGFYDENGKPMKRPSTKFDIVGGGERPVQFVGPLGSRQAYLFIGQTMH